MVHAVANLHDMGGFGPVADYEISLALSREVKHFMAPTPQFQEYHIIENPTPVLARGKADRIEQTLIDPVHLPGIQKLIPDLGAE
jgi:hypothetical protein